MKTLNDYLKTKYRIEIVKDEIEDGYVLSISKLKERITKAETVEEGMVLIEDAKREWIKASIEEGIKVPVSINICLFVLFNLYSKGVEIS